MNKLFLRFRRDIGGLLWLALAVFVGLALYSYSPTDPSFNSIGKGLKSSNLCGYFGSFLADALLQGLGLASWLLVLASLRVSYTYFVGRKAEGRSTQLIWLALLLATGASLLSVYFPKILLYQSQIRVGGLIGVLLSSGLERVFNFAGAVLILWTLVAVLVIFYTETPLGEILKKPLAIAARWMPILSDFAGRIQSKIFACFENLKLRPLVSSGPNPMKSRFNLESTSEERRFVLKAQNPETTGALESVTEQDAGDSGTAPVAGEPLRAARRKVVLRAKVQRRVENWELPKIQLLEDPPATRRRVDEKEIKSKGRLLVDKLAQFSVRGEVTGIKPGPSVTMFEFKPAADVKISKITDLADDLSLAMSSESVRIIAPIPGRDVVGIETSNSVREAVYLKDIIADEEFWNEEIKLPLALGRQADGETKIVDLRKMPHLLVAGTTGSGKSVFVVSLLTGLLFRHSPKTLKLILVDPKQVDLAAFNEIPHLIMPPIREAKKAVGALRWAIREMEKRYRSMSRFGARGLESFNEIVGALKTSQIEEHERANQAEGDRPILESYYYTAQPYICIVVEEFGDLMAVDKANVEQAVVRLAQMARACGIHLILAMQSPRKDVVTGLIKTNIPGRVSFKVASKMDSRIILDESGAERLLARGDMLFQAPGVSKPERHHGPFLSEEEIARVVSSWKAQGEPEYDPTALRAIEGSGGGYDLDGEAGGSASDDGDDIKDERYDEILAYVAAQKDISASLLQRRFRLGYPRAARMIEIFESEGVVGPANGSKPRQVLVRELK